MAQNCSVHFPSKSQCHLPRHYCTCSYSDTCLLDDWRISVLFKISLSILYFPDRYWHSTAAYTIATEIDGKVQDLPPAHDEVYQWPEDLLKPDLVLLLTVDPEERVRRLQRRGLEKTKEEAELEANTLFRQRYALMRNKRMEAILAPVRSVANVPLTLLGQGFPMSKLLAWVFFGKDSWLTRRVNSVTSDWKCLKAAGEELYSPAKELWVKILVFCYLLLYCSTFLIEILKERPKNSRTGR